jgi:hypothetical protein
MTAVTTGNLEQRDNPKSILLQPEVIAEYEVPPLALQEKGSAAMEAAQYVYGEGEVRAMRPPCVSPRTDDCSVLLSCAVRLLACVAGGAPIPSIGARADAVPRRDPRG